VLSLDSGLGPDRSRIDVEPVLCFHRKANGNHQIPQGQPIALSLLCIDTSGVSPFHCNSMELCLIHNDPIRTVLVTSNELRPLYAIETPRQSPAKTTTVRRFERESSVGHVESEVGRIVFHELHGTSLNLSVANLDLVVPLLGAGDLNR